MLLVLLCASLSLFCCVWLSSGRTYVIYRPYFMKSVVKYTIKRAMTSPPVFIPVSVRLIQPSSDPCVSGSSLTRTIPSSEPGGRMKTSHARTRAQSSDCNTGLTMHSENKVKKYSDADRVSVSEIKYICVHTTDQLCLFGAQQREEAGRAPSHHFAPDDHHDDGVTVWFGLKEGNFSSLAEKSNQKSSVSCV